MDQTFMWPWEDAKLGLSRQLSRSTRGVLRAACAPSIASSITTTDIGCCEDTDKVFCTAWLDNDNVLVGTKCNKLRQVHVPTLTWHEVPYPAQPVHRFGPDLLVRANSPHCGQHAAALSPSGNLLVTGGTAAEDVLLWRLQPNSSSSSGKGSSSSKGSSLQLQPLQTFMGHADWVFGADWLSDRHWVTAGRDGTIKLWQVPTDATAADASYTADPGCALLSVAYNEAKVRAISFDQQQQQIVALSTDKTVSWWTPDLRLKGTAHMSSLHDPAALATCGNLVALGSTGKVVLLDTRAPVGIKRIGSGSSSMPGSKRSKVLAGWAAASSLLPAGAKPQAQPGLKVGWLPPAQSRAFPPRRAVLAVTSYLPGMQVLQQTSSHANMDPMVAEQLLRQEAAAQAVAEGRPFDETLQALVRRLLAVPPSDQLRQLQQLQAKFSQTFCPFSPQSDLQQARDTTHRMQQQRAHSQQGAGAWVGVQQQLRQWQQQQQANGYGPPGAGSAEDGASDGEGSDLQYDDDGDYDSGADVDADSDDEWASTVHAFVAGHNGGQGAGQPVRQLPAQIRYMLERIRSDSHYIDSRLQRQQQQPAGVLGAPQQGQGVAAWVRGALECGDYIAPVRSLSFVSSQVLSIGHHYLDLFDLRWLSGRQLPLGTVQPLRPPNLLQRMEPVGHAAVDPVLLEHGWGGGMSTGLKLIVHTHCWDPSGTRVLSAGGPMALGCKGSFVQLGA